MNVEINPQSPATAGTSVCHIGRCSWHDRIMPFSAAYIVRHLSERGVFSPIHAYSPIAGKVVRSARIPGYSTQGDIHGPTVA